MALVCQASGQCFIKRADGKSQTAFVFNQRGHVLSHLIPAVIGFWAIEIYGRIRRTDQEIKIRFLNKRIPECSGNLYVDFADAYRSLLHGFSCHIYRNSQAAKAGLIGRRNLDDGYIHVYLAGFNQLGNLCMSAGDQIHPALFDGFIGHPAGKKSFQAKILGLNGLKRHRIPEADQLNQLDVFQVFGIGSHQVPNHGPGFGHRRPWENDHSGPDFLDRCFR